LRYVILNILTLQICLDRLGGFLAHTNGLDNDHVGARDHVANGKYAWAAGYETVLVDLDVLPIGNGNTMFRFNKFQIGFLPDGQHHQIKVDDKLAAFDRHRTAAAAGIGFAQFHTDAFQPCDAMGLIAQDPHRRYQQIQFDALFFSVFHFLRHGRHFRSRASVENAHILDVIAFQRSGDIDSRIAASQNGDARISALAQYLQQIDFILDIIMLADQADCLEGLDTVNNAG